MLNYLLYLLILGGHSISHSKVTFLGYKVSAVSLHSSKIVDKKEVLRTVSNTSIYCSSDKIGTVYVV
jgi:hypothetical protein